jgi:hypothetical protein
VPALQVSNIGNESGEGVITLLRQRCTDAFTTTHYSKKGNTVFITLAETDERAANALVRLSGKISINSRKVCAGSVRVLHCCI